MNKKCKAFLCVDPDTLVVYLYEQQEAKTHVLRNVPYWYNDKALEGQKDFNKVRHEGNPVRYTQTNEEMQDENLDIYFDLDNTEEIKIYRNRCLPYYFQHYDRSEFPTFMSRLDIPQVYLVKTKDQITSDSDSQIKDEISIRINLNTWKDRLKTRQKKTSKGADAAVLEMKIKTILSPDQIIKEIIKEVFTKYDYIIVLSTFKDREEQNENPAQTKRTFNNYSENNEEKNEKVFSGGALEMMFAQKSSEFEEYFFGDMSQVYYSYVHNLIRFNKPFECVLVEIPITQTYKASRFPPFIEYVEQEELVDKIENFDFQIFFDTEILFWHFPDKKSKAEISTYETKKSKSTRRKNSDIDGKSNYKTNMSQKTAKLDGFETYSKTTQFQKPRALLYNEMLNIIKQRNDDSKHGNVKIAPNEILSGECDSPLSFQLIGIEDIFEIYNHFHHEAAYNGNIVPKFITHYKEKKEPIKISSNQEDFMKKFNKGAQSSTQDFKFETIEEAKNHFNLDFACHNNNWQSTLQDFKKYYKQPQVPYVLKVEVMLMIGSKLLHPDCYTITDARPFGNNVTFNKKINFSHIKISNQPLESRLCFNIILFSGHGEKLTIGSGYLNVFNSNGDLCQDTVELSLWPFYKVGNRVICQNDYNGTIFPNKGDESTKYTKRALLFVKLPKFAHKVVYSVRHNETMVNLGHINYPASFDKDAQPSEEELISVKSLLSMNLIELKLNGKMKQIVLICRNYLKNISSFLGIFLQAIDWFEPDQVKIVIEIVSEWQNLTVEQAVNQLDSRFPNEYVRYVAVKILEKTPDRTLSLYLLQLVICLMYEPMLLNPLSEHLIYRSLKNFNLIGHEIYWLLRSFLYMKIPYTRFMCMMEFITMLNGSWREKLADEIKTNEFFVDLTKKVKSMEKSKRSEEFRNFLNELKDIDKKSASYPLPEVFIYPHDTRQRSTFFDIPNCKVMSSKKAPQFIQSVGIDPANSSPCSVIFKCGDDLRQDILTQQIMRVIDNWWLNEGIDFKLKPYKVTSTKDQIGFIEVVKQSDTVESIHKKYGGSLGALDKNTIKKYLETNNKGNDLQEAQENFRKSVAGYVVITYILGIGDRHTGNYMVSKQGYFFHIDFGHIMGDFKKKFGMCRERSKVIFTKEILHCIGKEYETYFYNLVILGYNIVRKKSFELIGLIMIMLGAGQPNITVKEDIKYLVDKLNLHHNDSEAGDEILKDLEEALNDKWRQFDNLIHNQVHKNAK